MAFSRVFLVLAIESVVSSLLLTAIRRAFGRLKESSRLHLGQSVALGIMVRMDFRTLCLLLLP